MAAPVEEPDDTHDEMAKESAVEEGEKPVTHLSSEHVAPSGTISFGSSTSTGVSIPSTTGGALSPSWSPSTTTITGSTLYDDMITEKSMRDPQSESEKAGRLLIEYDEGEGIVRARITGSNLVTGSGETAHEAVEELQSSIGALLDFVYGANGFRPTLHADLLEQVNALESASKALGIYVS